MSELIDIVNDRDEVVGKATQEEVYTRKLTHRIVHVFVIHPETRQVYLQRRAASKQYLPEYYCTSAGGHVRSGESYQDAAKRELEEELGLNTPVHKVHSMQFTSDGHNRFIGLYVTFAKDGFNFTDGEVAGGEFIDMDDAFRLVTRGEKIHPQLDACYRLLYEHKDIEIIPPQT